MANHTKEVTQQHLTYLARTPCIKTGPDPPGKLTSYNICINKDFS